MNDCICVCVYIRAAGAEDAMQRLAQKQDLVTQLRRQVRSRDESISSLQTQLEEALASGRQRSTEDASVSDSHYTQMAQMKRELDSAARTIRELRAAAETDARYVRSSCCTDRLRAHLVTGFSPTLDQCSGMQDSLSISSSTRHATSLTVTLDAKD